MEVDEMIIGYARVSTNDQSLDMQIQGIIKYAAEQGEEYRIYQEKESTRKNRSELKNALDNSRSGDTFIVFKLDRLARSTKELYILTEDLKNRGVQFVSLNDNIDTSTAAGKAMFGMLAVFAEFERSMIQERTQAGLEASRKRGIVGGRPITPEDTKRRVRLLYSSGESATDIAKAEGIGRSTVYKILNE
jgi:DNA invertase Pin-like site-specific DNA recombinase